MTAAVRDLVFVSYSHQDKQWLERLRVFLKPFERQGLRVWADPNIQPGDRWGPEIESALQRACVAVLLVSPDFIASDFIHDKELPPLMEAAAQGQATLVCVPVSASAFEVSGLGEYQWARDPKKPLDGLRKAQRNRALVKISYAIEKASSRCEKAPAQAPAVRVRELSLVSAIPPAGAPLAALRGVPAQPPHYLARAGDMARIKQRLLGVSQMVGITGTSAHKVGVHGMGGTARPCSPTTTRCAAPFPTAFTGPP
jgi:hypothetical protein